MEDDNNVRRQMPVWQKTPGRPSHLPVASAQRPRAPLCVSVWKAESWWPSRDSCPNSREPGSATRSFQLALGKHGHLQAGAPAPAGTPTPETLPIQLSSGGGSCHRHPPHQLLPPHVSVPVAVVFSNSCWIQSAVSSVFSACVSLYIREISTVWSANPSILRGWISGLQSVCPKLLGHQHQPSSGLNPQTSAFWL